MRAQSLRAADAVLKEGWFLPPRPTLEHDGGWPARTAATAADGGCVDRAAAVLLEAAVGDGVAMRRKLPTGVYARGSAIDKPFSTTFKLAVSPRFGCNRGALHIARCR